MAGLGLMLWCEPCGVGWAAAEGQFCQEPNCGLKGTPWSLVRKCTSGTGFAAEGAAYAKAHPTWRAP